MRFGKNICRSKGSGINMKEKRAQEEIAGFVVIVVLVAIIAVIFLGISLRNKGLPTEKQSKDVSQFLEGAMEYTSDCAPYNEPDYLNFGELIKACYSRMNCLSGDSACSLLNSTLSKMVEGSWGIGPDKRFKGFVFNSTYSTSSVSEEIIFVNRGNCSFNSIGGEYLTPSSPGKITTTLKLCYFD